MQTCLRISDAAALALHTVGILAKNTNRLVSNQEIADQLSVSAHHLAKVHQRLVRAGILKATRGPSGGFQLGKAAEEITLLSVVETVDGPFDPVQCLLGRPRCQSETCALGALTTTINDHVRKYLAGSTVASLRDA